MTEMPYAAQSPKTYPIRVEVDYPDRQSRAVMFFRLLLAIPAMFVVYFVGLAATVVMMIGWFAVVITGRYPRGMHAFVAGALRWSTRVNGYVWGLTDAYPPFSIEP